MNTLYSRKNPHLKAGRGGRRRRRTARRSAAKRGGAWFFGNKNDAAAAAPPKGAAQGQSQINPSFKYPLYSLAFENAPVFCDVCKHSVFHKIDVSVNRSKTATLLTNALFEDSAEFISHPLRLYMCEKCHTCKTVYAPTTWNGLAEGAYEVAPQNVVAAAAAPAPAPEAEKIAEDRAPAPAAAEVVK